MPTGNALSKRLFSPRGLLRCTLGVALTYAGVVLALLAFEDRIVFHPIRASQRWAEPPLGCAVQDLTLQTAGGIPIHARWFPRAGGRGAVLVCHSRAGNLSLALGPQALAGWQREIGVSLLIFDYPGYGRSEGRPTEAGCYEAAEAAYDWLTRDGGVPPEQVLIFGRSLGTAVAVHLASRHLHRALVLVSPPTSLPDVALGHFPFLPARQLMRNRFDSLSRIGLCHRPVFIVHGTNDHLVSFAQGERLFAAAHEPKRFLRVEGARHGDCLRAEFFPALGRFLADVER
jgi:uncharacterized protein